MLEKSFLSESVCESKIIRILRVWEGLELFIYRVLTTGPLITGRAVLSPHTCHPHIKLIRILMSHFIRPNLIQLVLINKAHIKGKSYNTFYSFILFHHCLSTHNYSCFVLTLFVSFSHRTCDAPKPGGPLTTRQPAENKWMSGYPTPLQKIGQSLLCTGSSTQLQNLHIPVPNNPIYAK